MAADEAAAQAEAEVAPQLPVANVPASAKPLTVNLLLGKVAKEPPQKHEPHLLAKTHL